MESELALILVVTLRRGCSARVAVLGLGRFKFAAASQSGLDEAGLEVIEMCDAGLAGVERGERRGEGRATCGFKSMAVVSLKLASGYGGTANRELG